jgi:hypothetical protein
MSKPDDSYPKVQFLAVCKHKGEWACVLLTMRGDSVIAREVLGGGATHAHAWNCFRKESFVRYGMLG